MKPLANHSLYMRACSFEVIIFLGSFNWQHIFSSVKIVKTTGFLLQGAGGVPPPQNDFCPPKIFKNNRKTIETIAYCFKNSGLLSCPSNFFPAVVYRIPKLPHWRYSTVSPLLSLSLCPLRPFIKSCDGLVPLLKFVGSARR